MLTKLVESTSDWFNGESVVSRIFLPTPGRGFTKHAEEVKDYLKDIKSEEGKTKLLVLALGAGEAWGANRNGDYFPEEALKTHYKTFEVFGNVHRHHINKPDSPRYGKVEKAIWNDRMKRVELVISVNNDQVRDVLDKLDRGEDIAVSMAAKLPYDICSKCKHKRTTAADSDTCHHIRFELNKIYEDGSMAYAINNEPKFFDISIVFKPADRTAYVLKKVASVLDEKTSPASKQKSSTQLAEEQGYVKRASNAVDSELLEKIGFVNKLAELEKQIKGIVAKKINGRTPDDIIKIKSKASAIEEDSDILDKDLETLHNYPLRTSLASLTRNGIILRPSEFIKVILGPEEATDSIIDKVKSILPKVFELLRNRSDEEISEVYPKEDLDFDAVPSYNLLNGLLGKYKHTRSLEQQPLIERSLRIMIIKKKPTFDVSVLTDKSEPDKLEKESSTVPRVLADIYGLYKAAAIKYLVDRENLEVNLDNFTAVTSILENFL